MSQSLALATPVPAAAPAAQTTAAAQPAAKSGFGFHDFLNIINPLQHIPVIGTLYREITGDVMKPISNILGGALFGGVIGLATSAVDSIVQETTGEDVGAHIMATLGLHHDTGASPSTLAAKAGTKPVPAFLVAEAAADRARQSGVMPASGAPVGTQQPSDFFRSLQRGGSGVGHAASSGRPVITIGPPKAPAGAATSPSSPAVSQAAPSQNTPPATPAALITPAASSAQPVALMPSGAQPLPTQEIPEKMMQALAKYEAMAKAQQAQAVDQIH